MQGQQFVPMRLHLSELFSSVEAAERPPCSAAQLVPRPSEATPEPSDADDRLAHEGATSELPAVAASAETGVGATPDDGNTACSPVEETADATSADAGGNETADEATREATDEPRDDDEWIAATDAATTLDVSVRHLRRLATAGKIKRRRDDGRSVYCINPYLEARASRSAAGDNTGEPANAASETGAGLTPDTHRAPADDVAESRDAAGEVAGTARRREEAIGDDEETVIRVDDADIIRAEDVMAEELVQTNRELMRLIDGMLDRWGEVHREQGQNHSEVREAMARTFEVQQCLNHWQHHAGSLERRLLDAVHVATRALDVADEALASRWTAGRRRKTLQARLGDLRDKVDQV